MKRCYNYTYEMRKIGEKEFDDTVEPAAAVVDDSEQSDDEDDEKCSVLQCDVRLLTMMSTGLMSNLVGEVIEDLFDDAGEAALSHAVEKFPELEIKDEEVDLDETNALKSNQIPMWILAQMNRYLTTISMVVRKISWKVMAKPRKMTTILELLT